MIFVTVGTHEQQFNRLIKKIDDLKKANIIKEEVFIQTGYSDYIPKYCNFSKFISSDEMKEKTSSARIVITHGGPATFMDVLMTNKRPIVVPRLKDFDEHVNNHQLIFCKAVVEKGYEIILVENIDELEEKILNYDFTEIEFKSNNDKFNKLFKNEVDKLF